MRIVAECDRHPPTTCSRRSPARNTPPAQATNTTSQAACTSEQPRLEVPGREPRGRVGHRGERQHPRDVGEPGRQHLEREQHPAEQEHELLVQEPRRPGVPSQNACRRTRAARPGCSAAASSARRHESSAMPAALGGGADDRATRSTPPTASEQATPHERLAQLGRHAQADHAEAGRSISHGTAPDAISSPTLLDRPRLRRDQPSGLGGRDVPEQRPRVVAGELEPPLASASPPTRARRRRPG